MTCTSAVRVITLYFSRIVPSRRKFSITVARNSFDTRSASALNPYRRIPSTEIISIGAQRVRFVPLHAGHLVTNQ